MGYSTYRAEKGMTFADFVNSQYNDGTISVSYNSVVWVHNSNAFVIMNVNASTVIVNGEIYNTETSG